MDRIHRDDLDFEVAEQICDDIKKKHPEIKKIVFAGDIPDDKISPEIDQLENELTKAMIASMLQGTCFSCGQKIPIEWPPTENGGNDVLPDGWIVYEDLTNKELFTLHCPECEFCSGGGIG